MERDDRRTIGKRGQGPGEIQRPMNLVITPGGQILVNDRGARFLHFFTLSGEYIKSISQARLPSFSRPAVDSQNKIVARYIVFSSGNIWTFVLKKFDSELNELFTIFSYDYELSPQTLNLFIPDCFWVVTKDDNIIWGYSDKYEFKVLVNFGAKDPEEAYGELAKSLVYRITDDFWSHWERQRIKSS
jgi:hypothetical protein